VQKDASKEGAASADVAVQAFASTPANPQGAAADLTAAVQPQAANTAERSPTAPAEGTAKMSAAEGRPPEPPPPGRTAAAPRRAGPRTVPDPAEPPQPGPSEGVEPRHAEASGEQNRLPRGRI